MERLSEHITSPDMKRMLYINSFMKMEWNLRERVPQLGTRSLTTTYWHLSSLTYVVTDQSLIEGGDFVRFQAHCQIRPSEHGGNKCIHDPCTLQLLSQLLTVVVPPYMPLA